MKKHVLKLLAAAAVLTALILGPGLLDLYRLDHYINSSAQAYETERGPWPQKSDACVGCHGIKGSSVNQHYPSLAGQQPAYLSGQLQHFASGQRVHPIMNAMSRSLGESDIRAVSEYFAQQPASDNRHFAPDSALREQGRQLVAAGGCAACHGEKLMGQAPFPRLAGQGYDYLLKQLDGFADSSRRDPASTMNALAAAWSPQQRQAIATFLASHPVSGSTKP